MEIPVLKIVPPDSFNDLDRALASLSDYDWVVFTSANGVRIFLERLDALGCDVRALGSARLAAIGPATAQELSRCHLKVDVMPDQYIAGEGCGSHDIRRRR